MSDRNESTEKLYRWYRLGCRLQEQIPLSYEDFAEQYLLQELSGGLLQSEVFNRTSAEWELDREDAAWTTILQRLSNMNLTPESSDLVAAIQRGHDADDDGEAGSMGIPAYRLPDLPVLVGAGAKPLPTRQWEFDVCAV